MEVLGLLLVAPLVIAAIAAIYGLVRAQSVAEFMDRPLCWIVGHPSPGSNMRMLTEYKTPMGVLPAEVWHCNRCGHMVTLVGSAMRGDQ